MSSSSAVPPEGPDEILLARAARGERDALDRVLRGEQQLGRVDVVADREVQASGWLSWFWNRGMSGSTTP